MCKLIFTVYEIILIIMKLPFIFLCTFIIRVHFIKSADIGSYEINRIEFTPLHDAIIYKDIADIINEVEDNMKPQLNTHTFSASGSEEDVDDLLLQYLHYLDKAHLQRINYEEKKKSKNKVPLLRLEKLSKTKPPSSRHPYDTRHNYINSMKYPESSFFSPFNVFIPHNSIGTEQKFKFQDIKNLQQDYEKELPNSSIEKLFLNVYPKFSKTIDIPVSSSCYCKTNEISCICGCKQCFTPIDKFSKKIDKSEDDQKLNVETYPKNSIYTSEFKPGNKAIGDKLNIRIKIDVQYPKLIDVRNIKYQNHDKNTNTDGAHVREMITSINLPFPYLKYQTPIALHGTNTNKHSTPLRKMSIHKKKKSHSINNNKKYTSKKIITFHSVNLDSRTEQNNTSENKEPIKINNSTYTLNQKNEDVTQQPNVTVNVKELMDHVYNSTVPLSRNSSSSLDIIHSSENTRTSKSEDHSERLSKMENTTDLDFSEKSNDILAPQLRLKRENVLQDNKFVHVNQSTVNSTKKIKGFDKPSIGEVELLYWPAETKNQTFTQSKNITALILERESKKSKLNMSNDLLRKNRTIALEQAIFGDVDWNDVDSVAPVFMSFVGKYIRGILTFCSQSKCHSMKCAEEKCIHRSCTPDKRYNLKGHCAGNNFTDSLAGMESIMDLPSNIAFEIVDILHDKMLGKMFGKATLCITSKCITFVTSKKIFQKAKCTSKDLSPLGHCPSVKKS